MQRKKRCDYLKKDNGWIRIRIPEPMKEDINNIAINLNESASNIINNFFKKFVSDQSDINFKLSPFDESCNNKFVQFKITSVNPDIKQRLSIMAKENDINFTSLVRLILKKFIEDQLDSKTKKHLPY